MMKRLFILLVTLMLLTGCAARPSTGTYRQITAQEAAELMESETGYIVLDVRTPQEYAERHIPGAINVPNETIGSTAPEQLPDREQLILIYCRSGNRSKQAADNSAASTAGRAKPSQVTSDKVTEVSALIVYTVIHPNENTKEAQSMSVIHIDRNNFASEVLHSDKPVLLDFWASWCGPCRMVSPIIDEIAAARSDVRVGKINVDEQPELARQFGIMSIPTLVVMKNGQIVNQAVGARPRSAIESMLNVG